MDTRVTPYRDVPTPLDGKVRFKVSTASSPGSDDAPYYVRLPKPSGEIPTGDTVEILVRAASIQSRDHSTALEQEDDPKHGSYCSGIVLSAGPDSLFAPGDRVLAAYAGSIRSHVRVPSQFVAKIPANLSFTDACSIIPPIVTAYHAVIEIGCTMHGDAILIHDGATSVGQAAIQLLANRGVTEIWVTASNEEDNTWITENLWLPTERILPKAWFCSQSMLVSQWKRKFDIILAPTTNSASPLLLDYVKSGGRYVIVHSTTTLSKDPPLIHCAPENTNLFTLLAETRGASPVASPESLAYAINVSVSSTWKSPKKEATIFSASDLSDDFSSLKNLDGREMTVVEFDESDTVNVRTYDSPLHGLDSEVTYLIAGGLGGLGRAMARWLVSRGARYLILLSRSGPRTTEARVLLRELTNEGVHVEAPCCDITNRAMLRSVLNGCAEKMPPIKGCIQSTMIMTELTFHKMKFYDWETTVDPKVKGSWNLHAELPKGLDFFILLSSIMGILGSGSLAAYNAGNTYEDALARYRVSQGERAIAIDLGGIPDAGYLVDHSNQLQDVQRVEKHALTYVKEICALLDIFSDPGSSLANSPTGCQAIVGIRPPAHWKHLEEVPFTMSQPFWGHMHHVPTLTSLNEDENVTGTTRRERALDIAERLAAAGSLKEASEVVSRALAHRVSVLLGTPEDRLDEQKPMHSFGIDSLSAIDIRNWVGKVFKVDMPVFDILGGATFASAGMAIAYKVQLK